MSNLGSEQKKSNNESSRVSVPNEQLSSQPIMLPYSSESSSASLPNELPSCISTGSPVNVLPNNEASEKSSVPSNIPVSDGPPIRHSTRNRKPVVRYGIDEY